jgi:hypothetical protein
MKTRLTTLLCVVGALLAGCETAPKVVNGVTAADITINFPHSDKYTECREEMNGATSEYYLGILRDHLKERAPQYLQKGQKLTVTFNDIDLAGDFLPSGRPDADRIRIIKPIYRPRMDLNFSVTGADGKVVKEGQRTLMNLDYQLDSAVNTTTGNRPLFYDKELLTRWLQDEFRQTS